VASAVAGATGHPDAASFGFTAAALVLPLALTTYPRADWRHPVDFAALATIAGAGVLTISQWSDGDTVGTLGLIIGLALIAHTWWRIERSSVRDRWALVWMALGAGVPGLVAGVVSFAAPTTTGAVVGFTLFVVVAPAMYVGVVRPEVVDVRGLVVHSVVFSLTAAVYVAGFMTAASLLEILSGTTPAVGALAVTGLLVATTFHPVQVMLRGVLLAVSGSEVTHTRRLPLALGDGRQGQLVVGLRAGDLRLSAGDEHVLRLVAPLLAQTLRASRLAADLQCRGRRPSPRWRRRGGGCAVTSTTGSGRASRGLPSPPTPRETACARTRTARMPC